MFDDSHLFDNCKPVKGLSEYEILLGIDRKLDRLIDILLKDKRKEIAYSYGSRYTYCGLDEDGPIIKNLSGERVTEEEYDTHLNAILSLIEKENLI